MKNLRYVQLWPGLIFKVKKIDLAKITLYRLRPLYMVPIHDCVCAELVAVDAVT